MKTLLQAGMFAVAVIAGIAVAAPAQGLVQPPCNWMDVGPERLQVDNPGSVTAGPLLTPGPHTVWVAVKQNDPARPYSPWTPTGPFVVQAGKKYLVRVEDGSPPRVAWTEEAQRTAAYRNPGSMGAVYFNNATISDKFYGIAVCPGGGTGALKIAMTGFRFGITLPNGKRLTYSSAGSTNTTVVKIDGQTQEFGHPNGKVVEPYAPLPNGGVRSTWIMNNVRFTQLLEPVAGKSAEKDAVLVRWLIRNEDTKPHQVGLRLQLDTLIGNNDGVPFTVPGMPGLISTSADFPKQGPVPHFLQALEVPDLQHPGTIAHLTVKVGGRVEPPGRVSLTHWPGTVQSWEIPLVNIGYDSAVVLYWPEAALPISGEREIGFSYGLGAVSSTEGRIGTTTVAQPKSGNDFPVTAYVKDPQPNETLTLESPPGIEVVGPRTLPVPPPPPESKDRTSLVTWKARAAQPGNFDLAIRSSTGALQRQSLVVQKGEDAVLPPADDVSPLAKLIKQLQDRDDSIRLKAAKDLGKMGAAAREAIPALQALLQDPDEDVRRVAGNSLRLIQEAVAQEVRPVPALIQELQHPDPALRLKAAKILGRLGGSARDAIPALRNALNDTDEDVRRVAANSLKAIEDTSAPETDLARLIQNLQSADESVRLAAAKELGKLGPAARTAVPALQKLLQDPDEDVRRVASSSLTRILGTSQPPIEGKDRTFQGELVKEDPFDSFFKGSHAKSHSVSLEANKAYRIDLTSAGFDTYLRLFDAAGKLLANNDDGGGGLNSRLLVIPEQAGEYRLQVTTFKPGETGPYQLAVKEYAAAGEAKVTTGAITKESQKGKDNRYASSERIRLEAGREYRIDVSSTEFDPFIVVRGSDGKILAVDDDGGTGLNSRLLVVAPTDDTYEVTVTTFQPETLGAYRLSVQEYRPVHATPVRQP